MSPVTTLWTEFAYLTVVGEVVSDYSDWVDSKRGLSAKRVQSGKLPLKRAKFAPSKSGPLEGRILFRHQDGEPWVHLEHENGKVEFFSSPQN